MPLITHNRINRPKDYSKVNSNFNYYDGDIEQPATVQQATSFFNLSDYRNIITKMLDNQLIADGTSYTYEFETSGENNLKDIYIEWKAEVNRTGYFKFYINDNLIYESVNGACPTTFTRINFDDLKNTKEEEKTIYKVIMYNTDLFGVDYHFYFYLYRSIFIA